MANADKYLVSLVNVIDHINTGVMITITLNGSMFTGELVSVEEFAGGMAAHLREVQNLQDPDEQGFDALFSNLLDEAKSRREQYEAAKAAGNPDGIPKAEFLHLKGALPVLGMGVPRGDGGWWRIRIADVDGWAFGRMGSSHE